MLDGRTVLVTGAASGVGAETARVCAALGASVILVDRAPMEALAVEIGRAGGTAKTHLADVADRSQMERLAGTVGTIDALVLCAAICPFGEDWTGSDWDASFDRVIDVNVHGPIHAARAFLPGMITRRGGRIVLVGSLAGRVGGLIAGPHYVASKGAVHAFSKWLAKRGAPHGVVVNAVAAARR
jgi:NAD(P)-dependent dehydrogenase (short-subunit alcohol dehydrogenase family)